MKRGESRLCWWTRRMSRLPLTSYLPTQERGAGGPGLQSRIGFALVGNAANGLKYPYNPFYGEFSPRVAVAWNPRFDADSPAGKIFGHDRYGHSWRLRPQLWPTERRGPGAGAAAGLGPEQPVPCPINLRPAAWTCGGSQCRHLGPRNCLSRRQPLLPRWPDVPLISNRRLRLCPNRSFLGSQYLLRQRQEGSGSEFPAQRDRLVRFHHPAPVDPQGHFGIRLHRAQNYPRVPAR